MTDKAVLITGAGRRMGRALGLHFADQGWHIGIHYNTSRSHAESLAGEIAGKGRKSALLQGDLSDAESVERVAAGFFETFPGAAMVINCAAIYEQDTIETLDPARWRRHMDVNALGPILLARAFHDRVEPGGVIINLLDQKVSRVTPDYFSYTLSKLALFNATRMLAMAFAPKARVNAIAPGLTLRSGDQRAADFAASYAKTPLGVGPSLADICATASLIAETPAMTGQVITLDGGRHLVLGEASGDLPKE